MRTRVAISAALGSVLIAVSHGVSGAQQESKPYTNETYAFCLEYPAHCLISEGKEASSQYYLGDPGSGTKIVKVSVPHAEPHGSDRYEVSVWLSSGSDCGNGSNTNGTSFPAELRIGGEVLHFYRSSDAGVGHYQEVTGYAGVHKGKCWQIQLVKDGITDEQGQFDAKEAEDVFRHILKTFRFIK
jgi:hypothetical protein